MPSAPVKPNALSNLLGLLDLERLEDNLFRGLSPADSWRRIFGGQVLSQALVAASRTVPDERTAHSMHAYFLLAGDPRIPIIYEVERARDGGSFTTRSVKAIQRGAIILTAAISFHKSEHSLEHQAPMPRVPAPEDLPGTAEILERYGSKLHPNMQAYLARERPIEIRPVADARLHQCLLAYASDFTLLDTALIAHGRLVFDPEVQLASLDHALWMHRPAQLNDWLLYTQDSPTAAGARGFCRGTFFTRDGVLAASAAQEGLIRLRPTDFAVN
jgi:acyl-CoA thioesterase II